ncbi:MFS transporter [Fusibacter bizertensis]|uniref:MFS transporter n=1 Tax=Fusibacter bizertensis TaxID=1488331 RepID=A0ABT6NG96_9FIRM|nr:MFS transporter [Fusibacter bizertensis]MDH8679455.1 MFS transporter [Fusibacter bizertensis]
MAKTISNRNNGVVTILVQILYWMIFCTVYSYSTFYLKQAGHKSGSIGIIIAIASVLSITIQPILGTIADKGGAKRLKQIIISILLVGALLMLIAMVFNQIFWLMTVLYLLTITLVVTLQPLINAFVMTRIIQSKQLNFGITRAFGSLSFAVQSSLLGVLIGLFSAQMVPFMGVVLFGFCGLAVFILPVDPASQTVRTHAQAHKHKEGHFFNKYPTFIMILLGVSLLYAFHTMANIYLIQIVQNVNGNELQFGKALTIAAMSELPTMLAFGFLLKKFDCGKLFIASGLFFFIKSILMAFATNITMLYVAQGFQFLSFALYVPASVSYIHDRMTEFDKVKGQSYLIASTTFGGIIGSIGGGWVIELLGVHQMLLSGVLLSGIGMLLLGLGILRDVKHGSNQAVERAIE